MIIKMRCNLGVTDVRRLAGLKSLREPSDVGPNIADFKENASVLCGDIVGRCLCEMGIAECIEESPKKPAPAPRSAEAAEADVVAYKAKETKPKRGRPKKADPVVEIGQILIKKGITKDGKSSRLSSQRINTGDYSSGGVCRR